MNASKIKAELDDIIARCEAVKAEVAQAEAKTPARYMKQTEYAAYTGQSISTIRKWVAAGLPTVKRGGPPLIDVVKAETWEYTADHVERAADVAAHEGDKS